MPVLWPILFLAVKALVLLTVVMLVVAYMTYGERKVLARLQVRIGPNRVGPLGLMQPLADALKLMGKEMLVPAKADPVLFRVAPLIILVPAFLVWAFIPLSPTFRIVDVNAGLLMILAVSSLGIYGIIIAGWSSNSKYSALGALRSAAQVISYELALTMSLAAVIVATGSMNLSEIVAFQEKAPLVFRRPLALVSFLIYLVAALAETNRIPFDLPEAESELVGGYHTEFSGIGFGIFYLAEYVNILTVCLLAALLFLGGWNGPWLPGPVWLLIKTFALVLFFFWTRGTLPRLRSDQLMAFGWKFLMPLATVNLVLNGAAASLGW